MRGPVWLDTMHRLAPLCLCTAASVGNRLWVDTNGNGVQDAGEPDLTVPVKVTLQSCSSQGGA